MVLSIYLKYLNTYQEIKIPKTLSILTSKNKPILNLNGPKINQLLAFWPKPNDFDNIKKSFTTPSGIIKPTNIERAVPNMQPIKRATKIKNKFFLYIFIL